MHSPSESDVSSSSPSSKDYYVESPSRDSHDGTDKSSSSNGGSGSSPSDSPSLPRSSTSTAASQISVPPRARRWNKHYCDVVREEDEDDYDDDDDDYYGDDAATRHCRRLMILTAVGFLFAVAVSVVWGTATAYKPHLSVKSLSLERLKRGQGSDRSGVPTSFLSVRCTANVTVSNPAAFFGIHVTTSYVNLLFYQITVATGQMEKYYQPKKSQRSVSVEIAGHEVPLYGAGVLFAANRIPFTLEVGIESSGHLVGKLISARHTRHVSCFLVVNPVRNRTIFFHHNSCKYDQ